MFIIICPDVQSCKNQKCRDTYFKRARLIFQLRILPCECPHFHSALFFQFPIPKFLCILFHCSQESQNYRNDYLLTTFIQKLQCGLRICPLKAKYCKHLFLLKKKHITFFKFYHYHCGCSGRASYITIKNTITVVAQGEVATNNVQFYRGQILASVQRTTISCISSRFHLPTS